MAPDSEHKTANSNAVHRCAFFILFSSIAAFQLREWQRFHPICRKRILSWDVAGKDKELLPVRGRTSRKHFKPSAPPSKIALPAKRDLHPSRRILVSVIFYRKRKRLDPNACRGGKSTRKYSGGVG